MTLIIFALSLWKKCIVLVQCDISTEGLTLCCKLKRCSVNLCQFLNFMVLFHSNQDFGASERGQNPVQLGKGKSLSNRETPDVHVWDEDDVDSLKVQYSDSNTVHVALLSKLLVIR